MAINNVDSVWTTSFSTSLPDGQYCDVISGTGSSGKCTGTTYVILVCSLIFFFLTLVCIQYHRVERFIHRFYTRSRCCRYSYSCYRRQICCCDLQTNWFSWIYWVHLRCYFSSIFTSTALLSFLDFIDLKDSDKVLCKI